MNKYEAKFREVYPRATIERQKRAGPAGKVYYLVRKSFSDSMYVASGNTKPSAWRSAVATLNIKTNDTPASTSG